MYVDGLLLIDKEVGITSYDVIRRLKKKLPRGQKIGHAGTLDPFATGLLIVLLGRCTKRSSEIMQMRKGYSATARFGIETDTQDITGMTIKKEAENIPLSATELKAGLDRFQGEILQTPPAYSAKKVEGKRAYDLARSGKQFELEPKKVTVYKFNLISVNWPDAELFAEVSAGTYVRTLVVDLARSLGKLATCVALRREYIGEYNLSMSLPSQKIEDSELINFIIND